jgi:hypothetical protein
MDVVEAQKSKLNTELAQISSLLQQPKTCDLHQLKTGSAHKSAQLTIHAKADFALETKLTELFKEDLTARRDNSEHVKIESVPRPPILDKGIKLKYTETLGVPEKGETVIEWPPGNVLMSVSLRKFRVARVAWQINKYVEALKFQMTDGSQSPKFPIDGETQPNETNVITEEEEIRFICASWNHQRLTNLSFLDKTRDQVGGSISVCVKDHHQTICLLPN